MRAEARHANAIVLGFGLLAAVSHGLTSEPTHSPWLARMLPPQPLYDGPVPNSKPSPDEEHHRELPNLGDVIFGVSHPTYTVFPPAPGRANGAAVVIFPGGGYGAVVWEHEGIAIANAFQERGVAAIAVKYRLPSDSTMEEKAVGPLQDGQQALIQVRSHAAAWGIDPHRVGVIGFSAGGHLASLVATQFEAPAVPDPGKISVRPDFVILAYPLITMAAEKTHAASREALLGPAPTAEQVRKFSSELNVTAQTPRTLILAASDDSMVDVDNSISFYQALHRHHVAAELILLQKGEHGFLSIPRETWMAPIWRWMAENKIISHQESSLASP